MGFLFLTLEYLITYMRNRLDLLLRTWWWFSCFHLLWRIWNHWRGDQISVFSRTFIDGNIMKQYTSVTCELIKHTLSGLEVLNMENNCQTWKEAKAKVNGSPSSSLLSGSGFLILRLFFFSIFSSSLSESTIRLVLLQQEKNVYSETFIPIFDSGEQSPALREDIFHISERL